VPDLGDTLPFSSKLYDKPVADGGVLVNATTAALTITLPDGTAAPGITVTNPPTPTGTYQYDYVTTTAPGPFKGRWLFTMATGKTTAHVEEFDVRPADPGYVMSLVSLKEHLNIPAAKTDDDEELRDWMESVTRLIESKAGEVARKSYTERHNGGGSLWLRHPPVISVTSIEPWLSSGTTYAAADVRASESGRVELLSGRAFSGGPFAVTYVAGRAIVPANIRDAAKIILKHLWESKRGASALPLQAADEMSIVPGFGFAVPNRALELLAPDLLAMNLA
jgi:hypothetical protein